MVMEASPSPQSVGREFVRQYYTLLNKAPAHLHRFYNNFSSFVHGGLDAPNRETLPVVGQKQIHNRIQQLNFRDCHAKISQVDAQATLGSGVVVQVTGELSNDGAPMRRFTQTFVLAAQSPKKYYVHNDIFRYQDIVFSDEEGSGSGRSEGEEEGAVGGYFPPAAAFPGGFPAPPALPQPLLPPLSPPALAPAPGLAPAPAPAPHLNGHQQHHDDSMRHVAATLHAVTLAREVEPAPEQASPPPEPAPAPQPPLPPQLEPEPEREPTPPPQLPVVYAPPEPKTYANLLKSGASRGSPPAPAPAPGPAPAPALVLAPAPLPQEQRPRPQRQAPPAGGEGRDREPREYRDRDSRDSREPRDYRDRESRDREPRDVRDVRDVRAPRYSDSQQLFLGNLPHSATEEELRALFERFGPVAELRVHSKSAVPGAPRHPNYGFITYESSAHALDCLAATPLYFPPECADGVKLNVEEKKARGREPPRRRALSPHRAARPPHPPHRR